MGFDTGKSFIMAERLKQLREEKGLSHEKLSKTLSDQYGVKISSDSLINYEVADATHTKAYKNQGMRVEYLRVFADFYDVSADYLLGVTDVKDPDPIVAQICNYTGLSERALFELTFKKEMGLGTGLNIILETPNAGYLLTSLERYYWDLIAAYILEKSPCANTAEYPTEIAEAIKTRLQIDATVQSVISNSGIEFLSVSDMYAAKATHLLTNTLNALEIKAKEDSKAFLCSK